jgi:hypothetical protein
MVVVGEPVAGGNLKGKRQRPFVNCTDLMKLIPSWVNAGRMKRYARGGSASS